MVEMGFEELFIRFWWLIFPLFGMFMAVWGMSAADRRRARAMELIKTYVEQGKDPPAELFGVAREDDGYASRRRASPAWRMVIFTAGTAGFAIAHRVAEDPRAANIFLIVAVFMGVMAIGSFFILAFGSRSER